MLFKNKTNSLLLFMVLLGWIISSILNLWDVGIQYYNTYIFVYAISALIPLLVYYLSSQKKEKLLTFRLSPKRWIFVIIFFPILLFYTSIPFALLNENVSFSYGLQNIYDQFSIMHDNSIYAIQMAYSTKSLEIPIELFLIIDSLKDGILFLPLLFVAQEIVWRGVVIKDNADMSFIKLSVISGIIWGIWKFPILVKSNYTEAFSIQGIITTILFGIFLMIWLNYVRIKSRTIVTSIFLHSTIYTMRNLPLLYLKGGELCDIGLYSLPTVLSFATLTAGLFAYDYYGTENSLLKGSIKDHMPPVE